MNIRLLKAGRLGAIAVATTTALAGALLVSTPAAAAKPHAAPSGPTLAWSGSDAPGVDACMDFPCQGATPGHTWSFSVTTGGLAINDVVTFAFSSTTTDRLHAVAMPVTLDVNSIDVTNCSDNSPIHPTSVTVDWANQTISFPVPVAVTAGQTAQFCFTDGEAIGMPLTPDATLGTYKVSYTEPGGSVSAGYEVLARRPDPVAVDTEVAPPYIHLTDAASNDVSNAGEAGTPFGFTNTTYNIVLKGVPNIVYVLSAESGRSEASSPGPILDPRVTVTCPSTCTTDGSGNLAATFTVSAGAVDHFVISADCTGEAEASCKFGDTGVTAFTATNAPTPTVVPLLPRAGQAPAPGAPWAIVILLGTTALIPGTAAWRRRTRWSTRRGNA